MSPIDRDSHRWLRRCALTALLGGLVALPSGGGTASASCAAPYLIEPAAFSGGTRPDVPAPGRLTVRGTGFRVGCDDTGGGGVLGCGAEQGEEVTPMEDVRLVLRQRGREWRLGTADAGTAEDGKLGQVTWKVELPGDVRPGPARLVAGEETVLPVRIR